jgi:hypothetical protein
MASGWYCAKDGDTMVTVQARFFANGAEVLLPPGYNLHLATEGRNIRATIEVEGKYLPLAEALKRVVR